MQTWLTEIEGRETEGQPARAVPDTRDGDPAITVYHRLSGLIAVLSLVAAVAGLTVEGLYRDIPLFIPQLHAQDLVTLVLVIPLLMVGLVLSARGSVRGRLLLLGALGYTLYTWASYAFGLAYNAFFLLYVTLFGSSLFTFAGLLARTNGEWVRRSAGPRMPVRTIGTFLIVTGVMIALLWLADLVPALVAGRVPTAVAHPEATTNMIYVLDLGVVVPAFVLAGTLLLKRKAFGYVLSGVLLVKSTTIGFAVLAMALFMHREGLPLVPVQVIFFVVLTATACALAAIFLEHLAAPEPAA